MDLNLNVYDYIYHSNCENANYIINPDPNHISEYRGLSDFGAGLYLSDNEESSYIWGARIPNPSKGTLNVYDILDGFDQLNGLILTNSYEDVLTWAITTGFYLDLQPHEIITARMGRLEQDYKYLVKTEGYDWVLARRVDDKMYDYLNSFLNDDLSFLGLIECYDNLSFGNELVIKSARAMNYIQFNQKYSCSFDKSNYIGIYHDLVSAANGEFDIIEYDHLCSRTGEVGVADILIDLEKDRDWIQHVQRSA